MTLQIGSLSLQDSTVRVMLRLTGSSSAAAPRAASARTVSRSEMMPLMRRSAPRMSAAPMRLSASSLAASASVAPGSMVTTSRPLSARMVLTIMVASRSLRLISGVESRRKVLSTMRLVGTKFHDRIPAILQRSIEAVAAIQKIVAKRSRSSARLAVELRLRHCRIERGKQQEAGDEAADMRLPGDLLPLLAERERAEAE